MWQINIITEFDPWSSSTLMFLSVVGYTWVSHHFVCLGDCSGWITRKMNWEKRKREESTVHESYVSKSPRSKPALLTNTISHQLSNRWVHTLENTLWLWQQGERVVGTWEQMQPNIKTNYLTNAKRRCSGEDPSIWSHANPVGLESDPIRKFSQNAWSL